MKKIYGTKPAAKVIPSNRKRSDISFFNFKKNEIKMVETIAKRQFGYRFDNTGNIVYTC
jgi:hypothetical protein